MSEHPRNENEMVRNQEIRYFEMAEVIELINQLAAHRGIDTRARTLSPTSIKHDEKGQLLEATFTIEGKGTYTYSAKTNGVDGPQDPTCIIYESTTAWPIIELQYDEESGTWTTPARL